MSEAAHSAVRVPSTPISVKGILLRDRSVVLVRNERDEWELPGGKLEPGERPQPCVVREIAEELGIDVDVVAEVDTWVYEIRPGLRVRILTFGCIERANDEVVLSPEHREVRWFALEEVPGLVMPDGYKRSIAAWAKMNGDE